MKVEAEHELAELLGLEPEGFAELIRQEFDGGFDASAVDLSSYDEGFEGGFDDDFGDGFGSEEDDLFAALDAALDELEEEQRVETREAMVPTGDELHYFPTPQQMWVNASQDFICTDKVPKRAPRHAKKRGQRVQTQDASLQGLLNNSLNRARMALDERRSRTIGGIR